MRFEANAAFVIGITLPLLETCHWGLSEWTVDFTTMFTDYLAGALLLVGWWASYRAKEWGSLFLILAWTWLTGLMTGSFLDQLEGTIRHTVDEPHNPLVLGVKFLLFAVSAVSLILSFKSACNQLRPLSR
jgi:hypothetical protein